MTTGHESRSAASKSQGDKLLWMLGAAVTAVAVAFFAFLNMGAPETAAPITTLAPDAAEATTAESATDVRAEATDFSVRLNRARLAMDADMLTEPEGYSAWSIYAAILDEDAANAPANEGLGLVAGRLVDRAFDALNAGRRNSAASLAERILSRFPDHTEAQEILGRAQRSIVAENAAPDAAPQLPENPPPRTTRARPSSAPVVAAAEPEPEPEPVDPIVAIYSSFTLALAEGSLRGPAQDNATAYLSAMRAADDGHAMTRDAEQQLFEALFARHNEAFNQLDADAALQWLDAAGQLQLDAARVAAAREQILDFAAVQAATESLTAADLTVRNYVPPVYPPSALRRNLEGWVDVAFVLSREGRPMNVAVTDASSSIFRNSATRAVEQWEFEPHTIYERVVEQHAFTRIRFVLED
jgi:TonB family protein